MRRILPAMILFATGVVWAQQVPSSTLPSPRVSSVFPSGGQAGTEFEVIVRGTDLDEPTGLWFSHKGLKAELVSLPEPAKKDPVTKGMNTKNRSTPTEAKFKITVDKSVPAGVHDLRLAGKFGISNPRAFTVGTRPDAKETEPNNDVPQAQKIEINGVMNGVIEASTDVDYFVFAGKKNQAIVVHAAAGSIDSRARPHIEVFTHDGKTRLAANRNDRGTDAKCAITLPNDGEYYIRVSEFAYTAGGADYFYRLTLTDGPWLDAVWPPMMPPGVVTDAMLVGRGVTGQKATVTAPPTGTFDGLVLPQACGLADGFTFAPLGLNGVPVFFATAPVVLEAQGDNDTPEKAQAVKTPCEVAGCLYVKNDRDCYRFEAKKGETLTIDLMAERIGTTMDAILAVRDSAGKNVAGDAPTMDDDPDALHPTSFFNRTSDPAPFRFVAPADGAYTVVVTARDANVNFGPRAIYRLRLVPLTPDYRVVAMPRHRDLPSGVTVTPAGESVVDVFVQRLDGFTGPVNVTINNLPAGVTAKPAMIGTGQRWGMILLSGSADMKSAESTATLNATASIYGKDVSHAVRTASIVWGVPGGQNQPTLTRLDRGLVIAARPGEKLPMKLVAHWDKATVKSADGKERPVTKPLMVKNGESIELPVAVVWQSEGTRPNNVVIDVESTGSLDRNSNPFRLGGNQGSTLAKDKAEGIMSIRVRENGAPGHFTVNLRGDTKAPMVADMATKQKKEYTLVSYAEPVEVTVLPTALAKIAVVNTQVKQGKTVELAFRVERAYDFPGEFRCVFSFPAGSGITAADVVIPAGETGGKAVINAAPDAKVGNVSYTMTYMAKFEGIHEVKHEAKGTVSVGK